MLNPRQKALTTHNTTTENTINGLKIAFFRIGFGALYLQLAFLPFTPLSPSPDMNKIGRLRLLARSSLFHFSRSTSHFTDESMGSTTSTMCDTLRNVFSTITARTYATIERHFHKALIPTVWRPLHSTRGGRTNERTNRRTDERKNRRTNSRRAKRETSQPPTAPAPRPPTGILQQLTRRLQALDIQPEHELTASSNVIGYILPVAIIQ